MDEINIENETVAVDDETNAVLTDLIYKLNQLTHDLAVVACNGSTDLPATDGSKIRNPKLSKSLGECLFVIATDVIEREELVDFEATLKAGNALEAQREIDGGSK